jgi:hypothetical protein
LIGDSKSVDARPFDRAVKKRRSAQGATLNALEIALAQNND